MIDFNIRFQTFGEETKPVLLFIFLILGFCGFLLLIILFSVVFVTLADDDMIMLVDNEDEDLEEMNILDRAGNGSKTLEVVKQSEKLPNKLCSSAQQGKTLFCKVFLHIFKVTSFITFILWSVETGN